MYVYTHCRWLNSCVQGTIWTFHPKFRRSEARPCSGASSGEKETACRAHHFNTGLIPIKDGNSNFSGILIPIVMGFFRFGLSWMMQRFFNNDVVIYVAMITPNNTTFWPLNTITLKSFILQECCSWICRWACDWVFLEWPSNRIHHSMDRCEDNNWRTTCWFISMRSYTLCHMDWCL